MYPFIQQIPFLGVHPKKILKDIHKDRAIRRLISVNPQFWYLGTDIRGVITTSRQLQTAKTQTHCNFQHHHQHQ